MVADNVRFSCTELLNTGVRGGVWGQTDGKHDNGDQLGSGQRCRNIEDKPRLL